MEQLNNFKQLRMEGALQREEEQKARLKPIYGEYRDNKNKTVLEVYEVGEYYQIAKFEHRINGKTEIFFEPFVNYKTTRQLSCTLEMAILVAIAHKHDKPHSTAPEYAARVLNIKDEVGE